MIEFDEAQARLSDAAAAPTQTESVPLAEARGRISASEIKASIDLPSADNSAMDGYALRFSDLHAGTPLPVSQTIYAGDAPQRLAEGTCARLFTGSVVPPGADTVVMQEHVERIDDAITVSTPPTPGQHIRKRGEDTASGSVILEAGVRLDAGHIALLASQGLAEANVFPKLKVGVLTTGDELVQPGETREPQQIFNSNGAMLAALIDTMGAEATLVLHARDTEADLAQAFKQLSAQCDLVLSVGGVSVGDKDLVKPVLESLGAELTLWRVRMKPGKPVALAQLNQKPIVCLPGNPVSAFTVFTLLVSPLVRRMQGRTEIFPYVGHVTLRTDAPRQDSREEFLRARLRLVTGSNAELEVFPNQGSGVVSSLAWATGLARIPADVPVYDGEKVPYYELSRWLA